MQPGRDWPWQLLLFILWSCLKGGFALQSSSETRSNSMCIRKRQLFPWRFRKDRRKRSLILSPSAGLNKVSFWMSPLIHRKWLSRASPLISSLFCPNHGFPKPFLALLSPLCPEQMPRDSLAAAMLSHRQPPCQSFVAVPRGSLRDRNENLPRKRVYLITLYCNIVVCAKLLTF